MSIFSAAKNATGATTNGLLGHALGFGIAFGVNKLGGDSTGKALVNGAVTYAAETYVRGATMLPMLADLSKYAYSEYKDHQRYGQQRLQTNYRGGFGGGFNDTQQAATMRQRGVQAIQNSKLNARSTLGSEARSFARL